VSAAGLAARCAALLGPLAGPVAVVGPGAVGFARAFAACMPLVAVEESPAAAVVVFLGSPADPGARQTVLRVLARRLPPGAAFVLVDHNQPRTRRGRVIAALSLLAAALPPARARYPVARELAALGFTVDRVRFAHGERVQLVVARAV
jgi:hypothetical protein